MCTGLALLVPGRARAGRLEDADEAVHGRRDQVQAVDVVSEDDEAEAGDAGGEDEGPDDDDGASALSSGESCEQAHPECAESGERALRVVAGAWIWPHMALEGEGSRAFGYARYPYQDGQPGLLRFGEPVYSFGNPRSAHPPGRRHRAHVEVGAGLLWGWVGRASAELRWYTPVRLEPVVELHGYHERDEAGEVDRALLGTCALDVRFAHSARLLFRSGLGGLSFSSEGGTRGGAYLGYGLTWFVKRPLSLQFDGAVGGVGGAFYGRLRAALGVGVMRAELRLGYDYVVLNGQAASSRLGGPQLSLRIWL